LQTSSENRLGLGVPEGEPVSPRPGNLGRADYPRMLYHADGGQKIVETPAEHDVAMKEGWDTVPAEIHQRPPVSSSPALSGGDPLATMMREVMRQVLDEVLDERGLGTKRRK
jgi:hypothetical protein